MKWKLEHYVTFSLAMVIVMTIVVMILTTITGNDYSNIYTVWCGIFGGEVLVCALIKIFKLRGTDDEDASG